MTNNELEKVALEVEKLNSSYGVSYSHIARQLGVSPTAIMLFKQGVFSALGEQKQYELKKLVDRFFNRN